MSRRLPVYLLIDTSGSMGNGPIYSVNSGLKTIMAKLRQDANALELVHMGILTFYWQVRKVHELCNVAGLQLVEMRSVYTGPKWIGGSTKNA